jgi:hypothetical protein
MSTKAKYKVGDLVFLRTFNGNLKQHVITEVRSGNTYFVKPVGREKMPISYRYHEKDIHECDQHLGDVLDADQEVKI